MGLISLYISSPPPSLGHALVPVLAGNQISLYLPWGHARPMSGSPLMAGYFLAGFCSKGGYCCHSCYSFFKISLFVCRLMLLAARSINWRQCSSLATGATRASWKWDDLTRWTFITSSNFQKIVKLWSNFQPTWFFWSCWCHKLRRICAIAEWWDFIFNPHTYHLIL